MDSKPPFHPPSAEAEYRQQLASGGSEYHRLFTLGSDGLSAVAIQVEIHSAPDLKEAKIASFLCCYFRSGELPVVLAEDDIVAPAARWELRASGLWVDMVCEQPFIHWSYGLEAFGLAIDEPDELLGRGYGDRVPLGWELDFESSHENLSNLEQLDGYRQEGEVDGVVLLAGGSVPISGHAIRHHWWGRRDSMLFHMLDTELGSPPPAGIGDQGVGAALPMPGAIWRLTHGPDWLTSTTGPI